MPVPTTAKRTDALRPFLRWAGSKQKLISQITAHAPRSYNRYFEPFAGSAALLLHLQPEIAFASDTNPEIVNAFEQIRMQGEIIEDELLKMRPDRDLYYRIRRIRSKEPIDRAIEFIYMNKVCWNGLYRVNLRGEFNVPYGAPKTEFIIRPGQIRQVQRYLQENLVKFECSDFEKICSHAEKGDFVFFDPPYVTTHNNNGFIEYNEQIFSWSDQIRLSFLCRELIRRGVHVAVTNAYHDEVLKAFYGMDVVQISRHSTLASDVSRRKIVSEALFLHIADH